MSRILDKLKRPAVKRWFKRVGVWGFLFFLIKGLIWLVIAWWALKK